VTKEFLNKIYLILLIKFRGEKQKKMAKAKTPKQLDISIRSLKKKIVVLEGQKKRAIIASKKKVKKKVVKKKTTKRKVKKRR
jgi:hypothetical protein